jgi:acyl-CoA synthetase (NDP forming)
MARPLTRGKAMNAHEKPDAAKGDALNELEAKRLLAQYGIRTPKGLRFERA